MQAAQISSSSSATAASSNEQQQQQQGWQLDVKAAKQAIVKVRAPLMLVTNGTKVVGCCC
jgi:hypothetical protein